MKTTIRVICDIHISSNYCISTSLAIPEDAVKIDSDDEDKVNPDERNPQSIQDKRIIGDNEFSDSEDEGPAQSNRKDNR